MNTLRLSVGAGVGLSLLAGALTLTSPTVTAAHETVPRVPESWTVADRLLVTDSKTGDVVVIDDRKVRERLSTPKSPISLAASEDGKLAFAFRGRNTDRDHVTMIDTAYDQTTGKAARPYVARTWIANGSGGVHDGRLPEIGGKIGIALESAGKLQLIDPASVSGLGSIDAGTISLGTPGHYSFTEATSASGAELLHVGNVIGTSMVLDAATGAVLSRGTGSCPALHGSVLTSDSTRVLFACANGLRVVPADPGTGGEQAFVSYADGTRDGALHRGAGAIVWGSNEGALNFLHRIDTTTAVPTVTKVALSRHGHKRTAVAVDFSADRSRLYVLTHQGYLQLRDGGTGAFIREVKVMKKMSTKTEETTEFAVLPDIAVGNTVVYVSGPKQGRVAVVRTDVRKVIKQLKIGGAPTRMVLLEH
ncbi:MAG: hypothetical protein LWW77_07555 [Propionibacteriales bacterium]|nr:hypothetical protein [Propionibacteriales bacterium]